MSQSSMCLLENKFFKFLSSEVLEYKYFNIVYHIELVYNY